MADCPSVCEHLHLPVQSGSDPVLRRMGRGYTRGEYLDLVRQLRQARPERPTPSAKEAASVTRRNSSPAVAFWVQPMLPPGSDLGMQMLQPMHSRMSSSRPSSIFLGRTGSAIDGRAADAAFALAPAREAEPAHDDVLRIQQHA